jgi:hypothetical protein
MIHSYRFVIAYFLPLFVVVAANAQTQKAKQAPKEYRLQCIYRPGVAMNYTIVEQTSSERTFTNGEAKQYSRTVKYFATLRCIEATSTQSVVIVSLDSLQYSFAADGVLVEYDSQKDITPKNFADLNNYLGPLNRPFEITYSPYGDIIAIKGEQVQYWRDYFDDNKQDMDSVLYTIWSQSLGNQNLAHYGDVQKLRIPGTRKAIDSTWTAPLTLRLDGIVFSQNATTTLTGFDGVSYTIVSADTLQCLPQKAHVYGIPYVVDVMSGNSMAEVTTTLTNTGTITAVRYSANATATCTAGKETFDQRISTTTTTTLLGQYQW